MLWVWFFCSPHRAVLERPFWPKEIAYLRTKASKLIGNRTGPSPNAGSAILRDQKVFLPFLTISQVMKFNDAENTRTSCVRHKSLSVKSICFLNPQQPDLVLGYHPFGCRYPLGYVKCNITTTPPLDLLSCTKSHLNSSLLGELFFPCPPLIMALIP